MQSETEPTQLTCKSAGGFQDKLKEHFDPQTVQCLKGALMCGLISLQIFVRQKNRSSARAPENSIKVYMCLVWVVVCSHHIGDFQSISLF